MDNYQAAKKRYAEFGVDTDKAIEVLAGIPISIHCWQGDDVAGFDRKEALSGGIQATGNYPGKARNFEELSQDFLKAASLIPGKKRINLHASYAVFEEGQWADRDAIEPKHFDKWIAFAKENGFGIDFNPTCFSHPMVKEGMTLSSPDEEVREFWIEHCKCSREISNYIGNALGDTVVNNIWIPDGLKDIPADRLGPRMRLKESLDKIFEKKYDNVIDCVESKVFGIGVEAYTVGSNEFYMSYAAKNPGVYNLLDSGHYHPTEVISDKLSAILPFFDKIPLHVTRPVRWDSDHVVLFDDEIKEIAKEIVRNDALDKVIIGLDFFDASINRVAAWIVGTRSMQKSLLFALLQPNEKLKALQDSYEFTEKMVIMEEAKTLPFGDIWEKYCETQNVPSTEKWFDEVKKYESEVLSARN